MNFGKGLGIAATCALVGAVVWVFLVDVTGMQIWPVVPLIGGAAGFGMMRAMKMQGGFPAGALAAVVTLAAIVGAHFMVASQEGQRRLAVSEEEAFAHYTDALARDMAKRGLPVRDKAGELLAKVQRRARDEWSVLTWDEHEQYLKARQAEKKAAAGTVAPLELAFSFGLYGTISVVVAVGAALVMGSVKRGSPSEEEELATGSGNGAAAKTRNKGVAVATPERASIAGQWSIPVPAADDRPIKRIRIVSSDDSQAMGDAETGDQKVA